MKKLLYLLLLAAPLALSACNDHNDVIDYFPYVGPEGTPGPPAGPDDDHCDC